MTVHGHYLFPRAIRSHRQNMLSLTLGRLLLATSFAFPVLAAAGPTMNVVSLNLHENGKEAVVIYQQDPQGIVSASDSFTSAGQSAWTAASAYSSFGALKVAARAGADLNMQAVVGVGATFYDNIKFSAAGLAGTHGFATIHVDPRWTLTATEDSASAFARATATVVVLDAGTISATQRIWQHCDNLYAGPCTREDNGVYVDTLLGGVWSTKPLAQLTDLAIQVPIVFGTEYFMGMTLGADLDAQGHANAAQAYAAVDAFHSLYWGGVSEVVDAQGNPVEFTVSSTSGTDYRNSFAPPLPADVPEPATWTMLVAGFIAMRRVRRRPDA